MYLCPQPVRFGASTIVARFRFLLLCAFFAPVVGFAQGDRGFPSSQQTQGAALPTGKYYALVIGINEYPSPMPKLKTAVADANAVAAVLRDRYGFQVTMLLDRDATRVHILNALTRYRNTLADNDNLLIYYAGHGYSDRDADKADPNFAPTFAIATNVIVPAYNRIIAPHPAAAEATAPSVVPSSKPALGIDVTAVPAAVADRLKIHGGVSVSRVTSKSFADEIGLRQGAVILEINRQPVADEAAFNAITSKLKPGDDVVFVVRSQGSSGTNYVGGTLP